MRIRDLRRDVGVPPNSDVPGDWRENRAAAKLPRSLSTYRRNVAVGITVLASLLMLGWMIVRFGANLARPFAGEKLMVQFVMDRADGVSDGSAVTYRGLNVGHVTRVWRDTDPKHTDQIWAEAEVDTVPPLPAVKQATIRQTSPLGTGANLALENGDNTGVLKGGDVIRAEYIGLDFLPPELKTIGPEIAAVAKQFKEQNFVSNLNDRITQAGKTLDSINQIVGDEKMRADLQASMANIRQASENAKSVTAKADAIAANMDSTVATVKETAKSAQAKLDDLSKSVSARLDQAGVMLEQVNAITTKLNAGQGTAGKLINDPKLYAGLVDTTDELNAAVKDFRRLLQQWEQEGISAKLR